MDGTNRGRFMELKFTFEELKKTRESLIKGGEHTALLTTIGNFLLNRKEGEPLWVTCGSYHIYWSSGTWTFAHPDCPVALPFTSIEPALDEMIEYIES